MEHATRVRCIGWKTYSYPVFFNFFSMEMNIYTIKIKTTVTWHHDYYGRQGYKKKKKIKRKN